MGFVENNCCFEKYNNVFHECHVNNNFSVITINNVVHVSQFWHNKHIHRPAKMRQSIPKYAPANSVNTRAKTWHALCCWYAVFINIRLPCTDDARHKQLVSPSFYKVVPFLQGWYRLKFLSCRSKLTQRSKVSSWRARKMFGPQGFFEAPFLNTLRPRQNGRRFADDTFKRIFLNENVRISIKISLKFVPKGPIDNIPALVQIMAWHRSGDKPLSEPMMVSLLTHICVTRPQWVNSLRPSYAYIRVSRHWIK